MAAGTTGFLVRPIKSTAMRVVLVVLAVAIILPEPLSSIGGIIGFALVWMYESRQSRLAKTSDVVAASSGR
jgi:TRAP-type uncharacterized transport system fused permease subunit